MSIQSTFAWINPTTLNTDLRVQRPLDLTRVAEIAANFNIDRMGTIIVSKRSDGTQVILDGQTRIAAKKKAGISGNVHAQIYSGLTLENEASMFLAYNNSKPVQAIDKFLVRVTEGDPTANAITSILSAHGWRVHQSSSDGCIASVVALERAYTRGGANGERVINSLMTVITKGWGYDSAGTNASLVGGISELFLRYGDKVDQQKLIREMQNNLPRIVLGRARGMKESKVFSDSLPVIVGRVLHTLHNQKLRRNPLGDWK